MPRHPIRVVARRTGLSPHVIRVWERRYGAVSPERGDNRYRQYSEADIDRLRTLRELTETGHGIGDVAELDEAELITLLEQKRAVAGPPPEDLLEPAGAGTETDASVPSSLTIPVTRASVARAVEAWDAAGLRAVLREAAVRLPLDAFLEDVLLDLLRQVGSAWERGEATPAREHMISAIVPEILSWMEDRLPRPAPDAPLIVIATPAGTRHDLGARIVGVIARAEGWRTLFLGADLPAEDIVGAVEANSPRLVGLSIVFPPSAEDVAAEIGRLSGALEGRVDILVGGAAAPAYASILERPGVELISDMEGLRRRLAGVA